MDGVVVYLHLIILIVELLVNLKIFITKDYILINGYPSCCLNAEGHFKESIADCLLLLQLPVKCQTSVGILGGSFYLVVKSSVKYKDKISCVILVAKRIGRYFLFVKILSIQVNSLIASSLRCRC